MSSPILYPAFYRPSNINFVTSLSCCRPVLLTMGMIISTRVVLTLALLCLDIDGVLADGKDDKDFALNLFSDIAPYGQQVPNLCVVSS